MDLVQHLERLVKTLEAGNYNAAPSTLVQGSALQIEDLSPVMHNVTFNDSHIKLQKLFAVKKSKGLLVQFNRQLSYGHFGGSAQREGAVGDVDVGDYVRAVVPMCFYSHIRRVTLAANMVETFDGTKAEDREAENAAHKLAGDIEFDLFKGCSDFSNAGIFDANPAAMPALPNILGVDAQIRQSDIMLSTRDLMFEAYGSDASVLISQNGALDQAVIQDASVRSTMNHGQADMLYVDPIILAGFNKQVAMQTGTSSIQRISLAGSAQDAVGADLRRQWVVGGTVALESSRFLSGKSSKRRSVIGAPAAPSATGAHSGSGTALVAGTYVYAITSENERGESDYSSDVTVSSVLAGEEVDLSISNVSGALFFNVYRTAANGVKKKFIGRVLNSGNATTTFVDLGNKAPASVVGFLLQKDCWGLHELASYSRLKLSIADLSMPEAHYRFLSLAGYQPRKNVIIDNLF